jgi:hypothetical protein
VHTTMTAVSKAREEERREPRPCHHPKGPTGSQHRSHSAAPWGLHCSAGHGVHAPTPGGLAVPGGQACRVPVVALYTWPPGHGLHSRDWVSKKCPRAHGSHMLAAAVPPGVEGMVVVPGGHGTHPDATWLLVVPGGHGTHSVAPGVLLWVPRPHTTHAAVRLAAPRAPGTTRVPAGQGTHRAPRGDRELSGSGAPKVPSPQGRQAFPWDAAPYTPGMRVVPRGHDMHSVGMWGPGGWKVPGGQASTSPSSASR